MLPPLCLPGPSSSPSCSSARCTIGSIFVMAWLVLYTHAGTEATRGPPPSPTFHHLSFPDCLPCGLSSSHRCENRASISCSAGSQKCPRPVLPTELSFIHLSVTYLSIVYLPIYLPTYLSIYLSAAAAAVAKSLQSCPTLCDPIDGSPLGSSIPGILQARTLEWVAISFSNACK